MRISQWAVISALVICAGCSNAPPATNSGTAGAGAVEAPPPPPSAPAPRTAPAAEPAAVDPAAAVDAANARWVGDLDGMVERGIIRVLTTYSKINYFVDGGTPRGLVHDAFRLFEEELNRDLARSKKRIHVLYIPVAHDELIPALLAGRGDVVAAGTLLTEWRRQQVDVTRPTRKNVSTIIVSNREVPPVPTADDLSDRDVYLRLSDVSKTGVDAFNNRLKAAGKAAVRITAAPEVLADEDILEMVNAGLVPMTMTDDYLAEFWAQVFPNLVINRGAAVRTDGQTGMLVRKNSPQLLKALDDFLARHPEGSFERNVLLREYLKNLKHVKDAASQQERLKLERTVALFRKYGNQYDLDFLLMAAQGYQESRLDQDAKSAVGAIGVMQVMPATGKELAVGDIKDIEANIHAGVKYVRQLMDRQFAKEPMDKLNMALFTFASYNAGPARIRDLRQRAAKRGFDPNRWFNNVEVITSEVVGRETVQYVANIYKYYLAYKLLTEQRERRERAKGGNLLR
jgi:membrane-bound lytic murein transglycosylase MltF